MASGLGCHLFDKNLFQFAINSEKGVDLSGVQTLAYCLISSRVDFLGFILLELLIISESSEVVVESFLIGNGDK